VTAVDAALVSVVTKIARVVASLGRADIGSRLEAEARRQADGPAVIVVAGEMSRGKSALINALLGEPGLLPTDVELATNTHVALQHGEEASVRVIGPDGPFDADVAEIGTWASEQANPGNSKGVLSVEISLPNELLSEGVCVVDTPGVGGLEGGHALLTLAALSMADALLFVVDAAAPMSQPELLFLAAAAERITTVAVAVTKTDKYPGWERIRTDDRVALDQVPRLAGAPMFAVSSRLKSKADIEGGPAAAAELLELSGFVALEAFVRSHVAGRTADLRRRNTIALASVVVDRFRADVERSLAGLDGDDDQPALDAARARVDELSQLAGTTMNQLGEQLQVLGLDLRARLNRDVNDVRRRADSAIAAAGTNDLDLVIDTAESDLVAIAAALSVELQQRCAEVTRAVVNAADLTGLDIDVEGLASLDLDVEMPEVAADTDGAVGAIEAVGVATSAFAMQNMATAVLGASLSAVAMPLGAAVAVLVAGLRRRQVEKMRSQQQARGHLAQLIGAAQAELQPNLERQLIAFRRQLEHAVKTALDRQVAAARDALSERQRLAGGTKAAREQRSRELQSARAHLQALADELTALG
jgi:hypothetical protein